MPDQIDRTAHTSMQGWLVRLAQAVRFFSRLPVPKLPFEAEQTHIAPPFSALVPTVPIAGLLIGILPALTLVVALALGLGPWLAATLSVVMLTIITGALHEDGLADTIDSLGGSTLERRLAIMRDSSIGSFGASALILGFALRIGAVGEIAEELDLVSTFIVVMIVASLSRTAALTPLVFLSPARTDGAGHDVGRPRPEAFWLAVALAGGSALVLRLMADLPLGSIAAMGAATALAGWGTTRFAARHLGGQTGDIAGATQQVAEMAALIGLLIALG